uniref:Uncharacterized protein n=2 Tax=Arundo donax TaxID=35708 RepID=A0A0A9D1V5_ARUDO
MLCSGLSQEVAFLLQAHHADPNQFLPSTYLTQGTQLSRQLWQWPMPCHKPRTLAHLGSAHFQCLDSPGAILR